MRLVGAARTVALAAALLAAGCQRLEKPRGVVLVVVDAMAAGHLHAYGYGRETSPNLDRLARESLFFERAYAASDWTLPSLATLMTGLDPSIHGALLPPRDPGWVRRLEAGTLRPGPGEALDESRTTLAERLREAGWRTAAVVSGGFCRSAFGFGQGFDEYHDLGGRAQDQEPVYLPLLEKEPGRPFFLYIHLGDAHDPYRAPAPEGTKWLDPAYKGPVDGSRRSLDRLERDARAGRADAGDLQRALDLYDGGVSNADAAIGRVLARLKELKLDGVTAVVVTADHGEGFGEHGFRRHGDSFYEEVLRVPLLMRLPGVPARRMKGTARLADVVPTLLEYLRLARMPTQGRSLLAGDGPRLALAESDAGFAWVAMNEKLIRREGRAPEFYELGPDPGETKNLFQDRARRVAELEASLRQYREEAKAGSASLPVVRPADGREAVREELRAAGYLP